MAAGGFGNPAGKLLGALLDAPGRGDRRRDDMDTVRPESLGDPPPIGDGRQPARRKVELGEA
ncbi:putative triacylglycerol lipase [Rosellinia necatrix]|uniref:Putative triacylglycerol lipase n=1 Tax=Rosellinia necatrix TaxID=77044 RepID=A0A1S8A6G4_ROSNE|nr:putative triacylglycerol lipase [Rosellinia necatrix]